MIRQTPRVPSPAIAGPRVSARLPFRLRSTTPGAGRPLVGRPYPATDEERREHFRRSFRRTVVALVLALAALALFVILGSL
jgi:hypothetical protein